MVPTTASLWAGAATVACLLSLAVVGIIPIRRACRTAETGRRSGTLAGTTLVWPCRWAIAAIGAIIGTEVVAVLADPLPHSRWLELLRYAGAVSALCPFVALLGAKRPQYEAWQFVVATFWVVLQTPALTWWMFPSAHHLTITGPWAGLLLLLMAMQCVNHLGTRAAWAALMATAGQWVVLGPFMNLPPSGYIRPVDPLGNMLGPALLVGAVIAARVAGSRSPTRMSAPDAVWHEFRDSFGVLWSLRVAGRMNVAAQARGWNVRLRWTGWSRTDADTPVEALPPPAEKCFCMLLRRFLAPGRVATRISTDRACRLD